MSEIKELLAGSLNPINVVRTVAHNILFARNNPDYFYPAGIWVFCGAQGNGKTLSAVQCLQKICRKYPKAIVVTNMEVKGIRNTIIPFVDYSQLSAVNNGVNGVIFFLDELHVLWNSLESKEIPISEMACFCQMRKNRRVIIGTAQVKARIAKPIREQLQYIIDCKNYFGILQHNVILDPTDEVEKNGEVLAKIVGHKFWFHSPDLYNSYDTLFKIQRAKRKEEKNGIRNRSINLFGDNNRSIAFCNRIRHRRSDRMHSARMDAWRCVMLWKKIAACSLAACLLLSCGALSASAASFSASGSIPTDVVQIFKHVLADEPILSNYAAAATGEGEYRLFIGKLQLDSGTISSSEEVKVVTVKADQSYDVAKISSLSLSCGSNIIYSDLGEYPSLNERGDIFEIHQTILIAVIGFTALIIRILSAGRRH